MRITKLFLIGIAAIGVSSQSVLAQEYSVTSHTINTSFPTSSPKPVDVLCIDSNPIHISGATFSNVSNTPGSGSMNGPCLFPDGNPVGTANLLIMHAFARDSIKGSRAIQKAEEGNAIRLDNVVSKLEEMQQRLEKHQTLMMTTLRAELQRRIDAIPLEIAKDEAAYSLLRDRLKKDLVDVLGDKK